MINTKCFECGNEAQEQHHVIPRSKGGTKTIPLCSPCHGRVHGIRRCDNLSSLIKEGLIKAKEKGVILGNPNGWGESQKLGAKARTEHAKLNPSNIRALPIIVKLKEEKLSYRKIAKYLNDNNYPTSNNKKFGPSSVFKLYEKRHN